MMNRNGDRFYGKAADILNEEKAEEEYIPDIRSLVKVGQDIMVQVTKQPFGTKGARITTNITIPSRSLVLMPTADYLGVSRRIQREEDRTCAYKKSGQTAGA